MIEFKHMTTRGLVREYSLSRDILFEGHSDVQEQIRNELRTRFECFLDMLDTMIVLDNPEVAIRYFMGE